MMRSISSGPYRLGTSPEFRMLFTSSSMPSLMICGRNEPTFVHNSCSGIYRSQSMCPRRLLRCSCCFCLARGFVRGKLMASRGAQHRHTQPCGMVAASTGAVQRFLGTSAVVNHPNFGRYCRRKGAGAMTSTSSMPVLAAEPMRRTINTSSEKSNQRPDR